MGGDRFSYNKARGGIEHVQNDRRSKVSHKTVAETRAIRLSVADQRRFVDLLLNPPALAPALNRAKKAHDRLIASSR